MFPFRNPRGKGPHPFSTGFLPEVFPPRAPGKKACPPNALWGFRDPGGLTTEKIPENTERPGACCLTSRKAPCTVFPSQFRNPARIHGHLCQPARKASPVPESCPFFFLARLSRSFPLSRNGLDVHFFERKVPSPRSHLFRRGVFITAVTGPPIEYGPSRPRHSQQSGRPNGTTVHQSPWSNDRIFPSAPVPRRPSPFRILRPPLRLKENVRPALSAAPSKPSASVFFPISSATKAKECLTALLFRTLPRF